MSQLYVEDLFIEGVKLIRPKNFVDSRGYFQESYNYQELKEFGIQDTFVQDNQSLSVIKGTLRGLHFQTPPFEQAKLIRVLNGAILDVVVDLRKDSPHYKKYLTQKLSSKSHEQLFVPTGCAHGFITLEPNTLVFYKVTSPYSKEHDSGIHYNDPSLSIPWPKVALISEKDQNLPLLEEL